MGYSQPVYNLDVNIWRNAAGSPTTPPSVPADVTCKGNLALGPRTWIEATVIDNQWLLVPWLTDIRDGIRENTALPDWVEVPAGSGMFYVVNQVLFAGTGFTNQHYACCIGAGAGLAPPQAVPYTPSPNPPPPTPGTPVVSGTFGPTTLDTVGYNVPAAGNLVLVVVWVKPSADTGGVSTALLGPLTPVISSGGLSFGSDTSYSEVYLWSNPMAADTITFQLTGTGYILYALLQWPATSLDVWGQGGGTTPPIAGSTSGPATASGEPMLAYTFGAAPGSQASWPGGWTRYPTLDLSVTTTLIDWFLSLGTSVSVGTTSQAVSIGMTPGSGWGYECVISCWNP